jgi:GTPase
MFAE